MVCMRLDLTVRMSEQNTVEELTHLLRVTTEVNGEEEDESGERKEALDSDSL